MWIAIQTKYSVEIYSFLSFRIFEDAKDIPSFEKFYFEAFQEDVESRAYKGYPLVGANIWPHSKNPLDTFFGRVPRALKCSRAITVLFPFLAGGEGSKVNANPLFPLATREKKKTPFSRLSESLVLNARRAKISLENAFNGA